MRDYGKIAPAFWIGATGRSLRGDPAAQLVAAYLLTAPGSNMLGFYYCPVATIANDTGLTVEGASKGLRRLSEGGFCTFDRASEWVWVHEMARFQIDAALTPADNRVKGIARDFASLPESPLKQGFHARYREAFHLPDWRPAQPFPQAPSKPLRSQEQEQEQDNTLGGSPPIDPAAPDPFEAFWSLYPKREGDNPKKPARAAYASALKRGADPAHLLAAVQHLADQHPRPTRFVPRTSTWLNEERYADIAAAASPQPVDRARWQKRLDHARQHGDWALREWGPMPGSAGCLVPADLIRSGDGDGWAPQREAA